MSLQTFAVLITEDQHRQLFEDNKDKETRIGGCVFCGVPLLWNPEYHQQWSQIKGRGTSASDFIYVRPDVWEHKVKCADIVRNGVKYIHWCPNDPHGGRPQRYVEQYCKLLRENMENSSTGFHGLPADLNRSDFTPASEGSSPCATAATNRLDAVDAALARSAEAIEDLSRCKDVPTMYRAILAWVDITEAREDVMKAMGEEYHWLAEKVDRMNASLHRTFYDAKRLRSIMQERIDQIEQSEQSSSNSSSSSGGGACRGAGTAGRKRPRDGHERFSF